MCGAPAASDAAQCQHCGARLATVACPSCFGLMFVGAKYCSHCGARADRAEVEPSQRELCPRCRLELQAVVVGGTNLRECPRCEGIWVDAGALEQICADREKQSAVLGMAQPLQEPASNLETIRYIPCPVCHKLMNRVNFANCSHVIVDVCKTHGTWFDKDELRRIVEFIRAGGLEQARARQLQELQEEERRLKATKAAADGWDVPEPSRRPYGDWTLELGTAAEALRIFLK